MERSTGQAAITYTYDDLKRVVRSVQDGKLTQNFSYDGAGRLATSESIIAGDNAAIHEWRYVSQISQASSGTSTSTQQDSAYYRAFVNDSAGNAIYTNPCRSHGEP